MLPVLVSAGTYEYKTTLVVSAIPEDQRNDWCNQHTQTCTSICNKGDWKGDDMKNVIDNGGVKINVCQYTDLKYLCVCNNNRKPIMKTWHYTVPGLMCEKAYQHCHKTLEGDKAAQDLCNEKIRRQCGSKVTIDQYTDNMRKYEFFSAFGEAVFGPAHGGKKKEKVNKVKRTGGISEDEEEEKVGGRAWEA